MCKDSISRSSEFLAYNSRGIVPRGTEVRLKSFAVRHEVPRLFKIIRHKLEAP